MIAEDDLDDRVLLQMAFRSFENSLEVQFVADGEELIQYLLHQETSVCPFLQPGLILLDLNMPKVDGRQALAEIKRHADFKDIPIVIWTTANRDEDRAFCKGSGASDFFTKPDRYVEMESAIKNIVKTWLRSPP